MADFNYDQPLIVVGCLIEKEGKYLFVRESRGPAKGLWNIPGGTLDQGEYLVEGAVREVLEETGYGVDVDRLLGVYRPTSSKSSYIFIFMGKATKVSDEISDDIEECRWYGKDEILSMGPQLLRSPGLKDIVSDYELGKEYPLEILRETRAIKL